ncbi:unnamed protein product [Cunninghamella blakesleeana]
MVKVSSFLSIICASITLVQCVPIASFNHNIDGGQTEPCFDGPCLTNSDGDMMKRGGIGIGDECLVASCLTNSNDKTDKLKRNNLGNGGIECATDD